MTIHCIRRRYAPELGYMCLKYGLTNYKILRDAVWLTARANRS